MNREDYLAKLKSEMQLELADDKFKPLAESFLMISLMSDGEWQMSGLGETMTMKVQPYNEIAPDNIVAMGDFALGPIDGLSFQRLAVPDLRIPYPPRFVFGNWLEAVSSHYFSLWGLPSMGVFNCQNVQLIGEYLLARDGDFFRSSELNIHPVHIEQSLTKYSGSSANLTLRRIPGRQVVLAGPGYGVYGHWLVEYLPKLGVLHAAGYDLHALSYLMPTSVPSFAIEWLKLLGIEENQITRYVPQKEIISAEELLLPTVLHNGNRVSPLFKQCADLLKQLIIAKNGTIDYDGFPKRIFLSRTKASQSRPLINRERIQKMAIDAGFSLIYPEELTLLDQVALFAGADQIIGEYGSALHGSMFSRQGTIVSALRGSIVHPGFIQSGIGEVMSQATGYVFGETMGSGPNAPFIITEPSFDACLRLIFGGPSL